MANKTVKKLKYGNEEVIVDYAINDSKGRKISDAIDKVNTIETELGNKVAKQDINLVNDVSVSVENDIVKMTKKTVNLNDMSSAPVSQETTIIQDATQDRSGLMTSTDKRALDKAVADIQVLQGKTTRLLYTAKTNPTAEEIAAFVTGEGYEAPYSGVAVVVDQTYHIWHYYANAEEPKWKDDGEDTVSTFSNDIAGIIKGSTDEGKVYANADGTGSVNGFDALKSKVSANEANITALQNSSQGKLTEEQLAAVNSGITAEKVAQIETNKTDIASAKADIATNKADIAKIKEDMPSGEIDMNFNGTATAETEELVNIVVGGKTYTNTKTTVDSELSTTSENAVQNKVVTAKINSVETALNEYKTANDAAVAAVKATADQAASDLNALKGTAESEFSDTNPTVFGNAKQAKANKEAIESANTEISGIKTAATALEGRVAANETAIAGKQANLSEDQLKAVNSGITAEKISEIDTAIAGKQAALSEAQLNSVNSGITETKVNQIETNRTAIEALQNSLSNITVEDYTIGA